MFIERGDKLKEKLREEEESKAIKRAFEKVKQDIFSLGNEFSSIKTNILDLKNQLESLNSNIDSLKSEIITQKYALPIQQTIPTHLSKNPSVGIIPTDNPTVPMEVRGLKSQNFGISTGNRGVPTDQPTNQQTDNPTHFSSEMPIKWPREEFREELKEDQVKPVKTINQSLVDVTEILNSLSSIKKEIRLKFKSITSQEMLVFSTIYSLEESFNLSSQEGPSYEDIALKLKLSPSSIRDYVQKLLNKGIPILKTKLNNKKIILSVSKQLRELATLDTIIRLREL